MENIIIKKDLRNPMLRKQNAGTKMAILFHLIVNHCHGGLIFTDRKTRQEIAMKLDVSDVTINDRIKQLRKDDLLIQDGVRGRYKLNERWIKVSYHE